MKDSFTPPKADKSHCHKTYVIRNIKENSSNRRNIPDGNLNLYKVFQMVKIKEISKVNLFKSGANNEKFTYQDSFLAATSPKPLYH